MRIDMHDTQPLSLFTPRYEEETREERFRRIKRFSELTGIRYCVAYNRDEEMRKRTQVGTNSLCPGGRAAGHTSPRRIVAYALPPTPPRTR